MISSLRKTIFLINTISFQKDNVIRIYTSYHYDVIFQTTGRHTLELTKICPLKSQNLTNNVKRQNFR